MGMQCLIVRFVFNLTLWTFVLLPILIVYCPLRAVSRLWCRVSWNNVDGHGVMSFVRGQSYVMHIMVDADYSLKYLECIRNRFVTYLGHATSLPFRSIPASVHGQLYWKPTIVDINYHIRVADTDRTYTYSEAMEVCDKVGKGYEPGRPLWDMTIVPNVTYDGLKFSICLRWHMVVSSADGMMSVLNKIFEGSSEHVTPVVNWSTILTVLFTLPTYVVSQIRTDLGLRFNLPRISHDSMYHTSRPIDMDVVRFIMNKAKVKCEDIMMSSGCAALHYHFSRYESCLQTTPALILSDCVSTTLQVMNRDPMESLKIASDMPIQEQVFALLVPHLPLSVVQFLFHRTNTVAVLSNITGPRTWKIKNSPVMTVTFGAEHSDLSGVSIFICGYGDKVTVTVHGDRGVTSGRRNLKAIGEVFLKRVETLANMLGYDNNGGDG